MERISTQDLPANLLNGMLQNESIVAQSGLDEKMLELVRIRVSQINGCAYCLDMHHKDALALGELPIRLYTIAAWRDATYYNPAERAALAFAESLTHMHAEADSEHIHDELLLHFTKKEIAYLSLAIAQINAWNRLMRSFGREPGHYVSRRKQASAV
jgi:AhpD family alkylhydroperoxidase